jgi:predicted  nucleic acid-binding Zn-ribbon protein
MMAEVDGALIMEVMRKIQSDISDMKSDISELKMRATATDEHLSGIFISTTGINNRIDRFDARLERIERRLDLTDAK